MTSPNDYWNGITAIATSLTVLVALGVPLIIWCLTKPQVKLLKVSPIGWFFAYKDGKIADRAIMTMTAKLQNSGIEPTTLEGKFVSSEGDWELTTNHTLEGHGTISENYLFFETKFLPKAGQHIKGKLILTPWGNRRIFWGKKNLTRDLDVPENQTGRVAGINEPLS